MIGSVLAMPNLKNLNLKASKFCDISFDPGWSGQLPYCS
jgi:hypothetical protein